MILKIRRRTIFTKNNSVRLRYVSLALTLLFLFAAFLSAYPGHWNISNIYSDEKTALPYLKISDEPGSDEKPEGLETAAMQDEKTYAETLTVQEDQSGAVIISAPLPKPDVRWKTVELRSGDTMGGLLERHAMGASEAYRLVAELSKIYDPRNLRAGDDVTLWFEGAGKEESFQRLVVELDPVRSIHVTKNEDGGYQAKEYKKRVEQRVYAGRATIKNSLYGSAALAGIPDSTIVEAIRAYSWDVDFQRDIRSGDTIEVLYDRFVTEDEEVAKNGNLLYAKLTLSGFEIPLYRFETSDGRVDYYDDHGKSIRKTLMKTPIDGARLSSGFGMRKHPVLGYNKMHKGTDFAAPTGTPIYAAGDGVVEYRGRKGGYGNYMRIRHNNSLKTAYAHMHKFAKKVYQGTRVKQGQVIGYVGTTGRSTGPHLHYEVLKNNRQVNPNSIDLPVGEKLKGKELEKFRKILEKRDATFARLSQNMRVADSGAQQTQ